jgi:hypothetical protein
VASRHDQRHRHEDRCNHAAQAGHDAVNRETRDHGHRYCFVKIARRAAVRRRRPADALWRELVTESGQMPANCRCLSEN